MKTPILLFILSAHATAHISNGIVGEDNGKVHTITKTVRYTTVRKDESVFAQAKSKAMAAAFSWPIPGTKSGRNEGDVTQLTMTAPTLPLLNSSQHRRHDGALHPSMATAFEWPSGSVKLAYRQVDVAQPAKITPTPMLLVSGMYPREVQGHEPTIFQIPVTGTPIISKKPKAYSLHRAVNLGSNQRYRRDVNLFNLKLTLPRSPGNVSIYISEKLAAPFCQKIPEETREDESDSKLNGSRSFYDLELGIGVGLTKIPVREDYAVKFCRTFRAGQNSPQPPERTDASLKPTTSRSKMKATAATATKIASEGSKTSSMPSLNLETSHPELAAEQSRTTKAKAKTATIASIEDVVESSKSPPKIKSSHIESATEGLTKAKATVTPMASASAEDTSDISKATKLSSPKGKSSQGAVKAAEPVPSAPKSFEPHLTEAASFSTKSRLSSCSISDSIQHDTCLDNTMSTNKSIGPLLEKSFHSKDSFRTIPDTGRKPLVSTELGGFYSRSTAVKKIGALAVIAKTTGSSNVAGGGDVTNTWSVRSDSTPIETRPHLPKNSSPTTSISSMMASSTSFQAQRFQPPEAAPPLTMSSMNSWYDSINDYLRTAKSLGEKTPAKRVASVSLPEVISSTPRASMTTLPSIKRRDDAPFLTMASINSWYASINEYLKTATANGAATQALPALPSSNAAVRGASVFGLRRRAKPVRESPTAFVRRTESKDKVEGVDPNEADTPLPPMDNEELDIVHTADEKFEAPEEDQAPPAAEAAVGEESEPAEKQDKDVPNPESRPKDEATRPDPESPVDDSSLPPEDETESDAPKPTSLAEEHLPALEPLKTEDSEATPTPTPSRNLVWNLACSAPPPSSSSTSSEPSQSKGCWVLSAVPSEHTSDSPSLAWGKIKEKEMMWTVMLGWTLLGLEVFMGGWEFVRNVRGDAEVGRRVAGWWAR